MHDQSCKHQPADHVQHQGGFAENAHAVQPVQMSALQILITCRKKVHNQFDCTACQYLWHAALPPHNNVPNVQRNAIIQGGISAVHLQGETSRRWLRNLCIQRKYHPGVHALTVASVFHMHRHNVMPQPTAHTRRTPELAKTGANLHRPQAP